jgi:hypothetical protein
MNNKELLEEIALLREKADMNKLVVFVGAGVSCNVPNMPSWNSLIKSMADAIDYSKCNSCTHKRECKFNESESGKCLTAYDYSSDEYLKIPQYLYNKSKDHYFDIIRKSVSDTCIPDVPLSKAIFELNPTHIITTNYDKLLESSDCVFRSQYDVVITDKDLLSASKNKYIIKMHGDIQHPDTIVLKEDDYLEYSQKHVLIELFVKALLTDHTILFLGYSLRDYNVKLIISWINYLRSQNGALSAERKIGYLVHDDENIDSDTAAYFSNNSIGVLDIHMLPEINKIPSVLTDERGRRLYSFLSIVKNPLLEDETLSTESLEYTVDLLSKHKVGDYAILLGALHVTAFKKENNTLSFYDEQQYARIVNFLQCKSDRADKLEQLLVDVGIRTLNESLFQNQKSYNISGHMKNSLLTDPSFSLYIQNKYDELLIKCQKDKNMVGSTFYRHFSTGYNGIPELFKSINIDKLCEDDRIAYYHNKECIKNLGRYDVSFDTSRVEQYIKNIPSNLDRQIYKSYLDIYDENDSKIREMLTLLTTLKDNIKSSETSWFSNGSISKIYEIKNIALAHYFFRYLNHLFTLGYSDASTFFHPYIEAIIVANSDEAGRSSFIMGFESKNEKYSISTIDLDIITKYISTKELYKLIKSNSITSFSTSNELREHAVLCFHNLTNSIVKAQTYGYKNSSIIVIANLSIILSKTVLSDKGKASVSDSLCTLFANNDFNKKFWNIYWPEYLECLNAFATLTKSLTPRTNTECIKSIISIPEFLTYSVSSNFCNVKRLLRFFLCKDDFEYYKDYIYSLIDNE